MSLNDDMLCFRGNSCPYFWFKLMFVAVVARSCWGQNRKACYSPLGMENGGIPDAYITATSSHGFGTGPKYARLHSEKGDGAWCPKDVVDPGTQDKYLQIRLLNASCITRIATQGRYGGGNGNEYTRNYKVNYSRDGVSWFSWTNHNGASILHGNIDTSTVKVQSFFPRITGATFIRIIPVTSLRMPVCLRLELYGCLWRSGLLSYSIPTPDHPTSHFHMFSDDTYDGWKSPTLYSGGLGQLTDGVIGRGSVGETMSRFATNSTGYDYVGWTQGRGKKVTMMFRFDQVRNISVMRVFCNTNEAVGASLFKAVSVMGSLDGFTFINIARTVNRPISSKYTSRVATILLDHHLASTLKVTFELGRGRLLISEVQFHNEVVSRDDLDRHAGEDSWTEDMEDWDFTQTPVTGSGATSTSAIIVGVLVGLVLLLVIVVVAMYLWQRKLRKTMIPPSYTFHTESSFGDNLVTLAPRLPPSSAAATCESKCSMPVYHEIETSPNNVYLDPIDVVGRSPPPPYQEHETAGCSGQCSGKSVPHYAETNVFLRTFDSQPLQGVTGNNIYAVPCITPSPQGVRRDRRKRMCSDTLHGTTSDVLDTTEECSALLDQFRVRRDDLPPEFPRSKLKLVENLGEGQFGEVQLCLADKSLRDVCCAEEFVLPGKADSNVLVAVKVLQENASDDAKANFFKEVRVMSRLFHPNIVRLLAVCTEAEPLAMITEYMDCGDLFQYLRSYDDDMKTSPERNTIQNDVLLKLSVQISAGMNYLSSLNFVHRDLAARNCLVGSDNQIRIGDFGMSRNMYQSDYYKIKGRAVLPIRWMAWECVLMGMFSSSSDVWAFGVTLWEVYSLCKLQPFSTLTDQQVIENMHHFYRRSGEEVLLPRPRRCPASLFNVIRKCWRRNAQDRPTFQQLYIYLQERQHSVKVSPKPKRPQSKPPVPKVRKSS